MIAPVFIKPLAAGLAGVVILTGVYMKGRHDAANAWRPKVEQAESDRDEARRSVASVNAAIAAQNASLETKARADAQRLASAEKALSEAQRGRASAEARANKLLRTPAVGVDSCARAEDARRQVLEALR